MNDVKAVVEETEKTGKRRLHTDISALPDDVLIEVFSLLDIGDLCRVEQGKHACNYLSVLCVFTLAFDNGLSWLGLFITSLHALAVECARGVEPQALS